MEVRCASVVQTTSMSVRVFIRQGDPAIVTFVVCVSVLNQQHTFIEDVFSLEHTQDGSRPNSSNTHIRRKVELVHLQHRFHLGKYSYSPKWIKYLRIE